MTTTTNSRTSQSMAYPGFRYLRLAAGFSLLVAAALAMARPLAGQEVHRLDGPRVAIYNLAGRVDVVPGEGPHAVVEITRGGDDAGQLSVVTGRVGDREALRVIYPDDRVVYPGMGRSNTTVRVRDDGTFLEGWRGGDEVRISGRGRGLEAYADITVRVPPGFDVAIRLAAGEGRASGLEAALAFKAGSARVNVSDVNGNVDVDTGSGAVTIVGVEGDVSADTGSGAISLEGIHGTRLTADTGSGRVEGRNLSLGELSVDTGSGRITMEGLRVARIDCDTGSGAVRLSLLSDVDHMVVDTGSGSVTVDVPEDFGAQLDMDSGSGRVEVDVAAHNVTVEKRRSFRGAVGDGDGRVEIDTGSGGISIRRR